MQTCDLVLDVSTHQLVEDDALWPLAAQHAGGVEVDQLARGDHAVAAGKVGQEWCRGFQCERCKGECKAGLQGGRRASWLLLKAD
jgi:hypothetical protein